MEKLGWSEGRNIRIVRFALVCGVAVGRRVRVFAPRWARVALLRYFRALCWVLCEEAKLFALRQDLTFHRLHRGRSVPVILSFHPSVVWPCAAGTQNANLFGIMPPFDRVDVHPEKGAATKVAESTLAMPAANIPIVAILTAAMFSSL